MLSGPHPRQDWRLPISLGSVPAGTAPLTLPNPYTTALILTVTTAVCELRCGPRRTRFPPTHCQFPIGSLVHFVFRIVGTKSCHDGQAIAFPPLLLFVS